MHRLLLIPLSLLVLVFAGAGTGLQAAEEGHDHDHDHGHDHAHSPLMEAMEAINRAFKTIRRHAATPEKRGEVLAAVDTMITHATAAKAHFPAVIATLPEAQRSAAKEDYLERMSQVVTELEALKLALQAGDTAKIEARIAAIKTAKSEGHERYVPEED